MLQKALKDRIKPENREQWGTADRTELANETGLIAALILLILLATSSDAALRRLGMVRWKRWQRWNYACFALAAAHGLGYLLGIEALKPAWLALVMCMARRS